MGIFKPQKSDYTYTQKGDKPLKLLKNEKLNEFSPILLGLGDVNKPSYVLNSLCAIFDLEGFTNFCKQIEPQLSVPVFLNEYLKWIFEELKNETIDQKESEGVSEGVALWHDLPYYTKFMGDGLLVIWDTTSMSTIGQANIIISMGNICDNYNDFYIKMKRKASDIPPKLRCGIAKGNIYSVGNGNDFVGPCINLTARLQKMPGARICFANRGFNVEDVWINELAGNLDDWILKKVAIKGMGTNELIYILKDDFENMSEEDKKFYQDP